MFAAKDTLLTRPSGAYRISRSVRLRSSASAYLNRTNGTPTNANIYSFSFWVKRGTIGVQNNLVGAGQSSGTNFAQFTFGSSDTLTYSESGVTWNLTTTQVFRDPSAWYHLIFVYDSTQATSTNRAKIYVNGVQVTALSSTVYPTLNSPSYFNTSGYIRAIGNIWYNGAPGGFYSDCYMTEMNFIDGQALTPSSFGETNAVTGVWQPKAYSGTYGTNGFELNFSDNSTAAALGTDFSGNSNTWTVNNISVTAGVTYDSMLDVPTLYADGGNGRGNYCVLNPLDRNTNLAPSDANLTYAVSGAVQYSTRSTIFPTSGKWYAEFTISSSSAIIAIANQNAAVQGVNGLNGVFALTTFIYNNSGTAAQSGLAAFVASDVIAVAYDADTNSVQFYRNNSTYGTAVTPSATGPFCFFVGGNGATCTVNANFGQRPFTYTPPSGFVALNTQNLPTPTISNGASYMAATTYTGTGSALTIANTVGSASFQPDLVWVKGRSGATDHAWYDAVRGVQLQLESNTTTDETTETTGLTTFGSTGFTVGALAQMNTSAATYVAWQWKEGATQGFDIVTYTGNGSARTISHNLGVAPNMIIVKARTTASTDQGWPVYHSANTAAPATDYLLLNSTAATADLDTVWNDTAPTSSVFSVGTNANVNANNDTYVAYCFAAVAGYSAFGSYTGNGSADGPFVYLGFRPRFIMIKGSSDADRAWVMLDTARNTSNAVNLNLYANASDAEATDTRCDALSNGFKIRGTGTWVNNSSSTYIYMAFAENPFKLSLAR
jgi:hypothetical protein